MKQETPRQLWAPRSAMTLLEILIAMGIFMLGTIGILTLFPVAIRNISIAVNRTLGAAVAKNAIASMRLFAIDLYWVPDDFATIHATSDIELDGRFGSSFSHAVRDYHLDAIASGGTDGRYLGHGVYHDSFKIPGDVDLPAVLVGGGGAYVAVPWHEGFGWTATLRPMPKDDDGDYDLRGADEDPAGLQEEVDDDDDDALGPDGPYDEDGPNIDDNTAYQTQIAVWRNYALVSSGGATADFVNGSPIVDITEGGAGDPDLWNRVKPGDYMRHEGHGVWCQIAEVNPGVGLADGQLVLTKSFSHPFGIPPGEPAQFANRFRLVSLYDTVIGPEN